jgi:hypothetical protein
LLNNRRKPTDTCTKGNPKAVRIHTIDVRISPSLARCYHSELTASIHATRLNTIQLSNNQFTGPLPLELFHLPRLQALVADVFGARSLGKILGAITVIDATGGAIGPWITGMAYDAVGNYQLGFGIMAVLIGIAFVAAMLVRMPAKPAH